MVCRNLLAVNGCGGDKQAAGRNSIADASIGQAFIAGGRVRKLFILPGVAGQRLALVRQGVNRRALLAEQQGEDQQQKWQACQAGFHGA